MRLFIIALTSLFIAAGCATAPQMLTPPPAQHNDFKFYQFPPSITESHVSVNLNDAKTITYIQNFGGGGVGVGLLLGPIGVLANIEMIEANTEEDKALLYGKLPVDIHQVFTQVSQQANLRLVETAQSKISPYLLVVRDEDEVLRLAAAMAVEMPLTGEKSWSGLYLYQLEQTFTKAELGAGLTALQNAEFEALLAQGFTETLKLYDTDRKAQLISTTPVEFESSLISPRFAIAQRGEIVEKQANRTVLRGMAAIYSLPNDAFKITRYLPKKKG